MIEKEEKKGCNKEKDDCFSYQGTLHRYLLSQQKTNDKNTAYQQNTLSSPQCRSKVLGVVGDTCVVELFSLCHDTSAASPTQPDTSQLQVQWSRIVM